MALALKRFIILLGHSIQFLFILLCPKPLSLKTGKPLIISETGLDMGSWNTEKQFSCLLGLCPNNLISRLTPSHPQGLQPAAATVRLCAQSLTHGKSALGAKYHRLRARLGGRVEKVSVKEWESERLSKLATGAEDRHRFAGALGAKR